MLYTDHFNTFLAPADDGGGNTADGAGADEPTATDGGDGTDAATTGEETTDEKAFTQTELETILTDRLARQEKKLRRDHEKALQKAVDEKLKDESEWQTLADKRQARIAKLEAEAEQTAVQLEELETYQKAVADYAAKLSDGQPDGVKALLAKLTPVERLNWLTEHGQAETPTTPGVPPTPPANPSSKLTDEQRRQQAYRASL